MRKLLSFAAAVTLDLATLLLPAAWLLSFRFTGAGGLRHLTTLVDGRGTGFSGSVTVLPGRVYLAAALEPFDVRTAYFLVQPGKTDFQWKLDARTETASPSAIEGRCWLPTFHSSGSLGQGNGVEIFVPLYSITLVCIAAQLVRIDVARRRRGRQTICRCVTCGYDLRASPDYCPECGTAVVSVPSSDACSDSIRR